MNVLVLMAGRDDAFRDAGYLYPKNLAEIAGIPLLERVIENLSLLRKLEEDVKFYFVVREDENRRHHTGEIIQLLVPDATVVEVQEPTAGAACTALLAINHISGEDSLLICNGDQIVETDLVKMIRQFKESRWDGGIAVFEAVHPRWSYVRVGADGLVRETAEKRPISKNATAGLYWFARGSDFVKAAMDTIRKDAHVEGIFYICPVYNEMILKQKRIGIEKISRSAYWSLATPRSLAEYESALQNNGDSHA